MIVRLGNCAGCYQVRALVRPGCFSASRGAKAAPQSSKHPVSRRLSGASVRAQAMGTTENGNRPTHLMDSVWDQAKLQTYEYPQLKEDLKADVCVIGAGMDGLSIAYQLAKAGKSVIVLEARSRGSGQSGRESGQLMLWNNDYYGRIEEALGEHYAKKAARSHLAAIDYVEKVVNEEGIECGFKRVDGYLFPKADADQQTLEKELAAAVRSGLTDVKMVNLKKDAAAGGIGQALQFPGCANIQPLHYVNGLARALTQKYGGRIFENSRVTKMNGKHVHVKEGFKVDADHVVMATRSPVHHNLIVHSRQEPFKTYIVALKVPKDGVKDAQFWDTDEPFHYVRLEEHPEAGPVLLVGGENHKTGMKPDEYEDKYAKLEGWARQRWPAAGEVAFRWCGQVYEPHDYLALYGKDPLNDFQLGGTHYVATGDSGQAMTGAALAAMVLGAEILGTANEFGEIYSPARAPPAHLKSLAEAGEYFTTVAKALSEVVNPTYQRDIEDIVPGCGAILQKGLEKVAVYKDETGETHAFRAACPHLGCLVQWNPIQSTFDCPCHGSYFDKYGRVVQGPAKADLDRVELKTLIHKSVA